MSESAEIKNPVNNLIEEGTNWLDNINLPENYHPSDNEEYMSDLQLKYFWQKLQGWRLQLITESDQTLEELKDLHMQEPDETDRASKESETAVELRTRERYLKLISKIDNALQKIVNRTYGFCEASGEPIGVKRLDARPIASLSVAAQEQHERKKRLMHEETEDQNL